MRALVCLYVCHATDHHEILYTRCHGYSNDGLLFIDIIITIFHYHGANSVYVVCLIATAENKRKYSEFLASDIITIQRAFVMSHMCPHIILYLLSASADDIVKHFECFRERILTHKFKEYRLGFNRLWEDK